MPRGARERPSTRGAAGSAATAAEVYPRARESQMRVTDALWRFGPSAVAISVWLAHPGSVAAHASADAAPGGSQRCEIDEGPLACGDDWVCDVFRGRCVAPCEGARCCEGVICPPGSVCAAVAGRCAAPAGAGCFNLGTTWWTGRDAPPDARGASREATPRQIEIRNDGVAPLYFDVTGGQSVRFDILKTERGRVRHLELGENHFCPCQCPAEGPPRCRDCGPPQPSVRRLSPGGRVRVAWSGDEQPWTRRACEKPPGEMCLEVHASLPGTYTLEVCAHTSVADREPDGREADRLWNAKVAGERRCRRVDFSHPGTSPIVVRFGR